MQRNVANQSPVTGEAANQGRLRLDESQSYQDLLLQRTQRGGGGFTRMLVQEREM